MALHVDMHMDKNIGASPDQGSHEIALYTAAGDSLAFAIPTLLRPKPPAYSAIRCSSVPVVIYSKDHDLLADNIISRFDHMQQLTLRCTMRAAELILIYSYWGRQSWFISCQCY